MHLADDINVLSEAHVRIQILRRFYQKVAFTKLYGLYLTLVPAYRNYFADVKSAGLGAPKTNHS